MSPGVNQHGIAPRRARALARDLLDWYADHARDLPWRQSRDPYAIWISEVMLQQTRVEVVVGRWERFMRRFGDLETLAQAPESEVLSEWAGLGYYRRVRALHRAARELVDRGTTELPRSAAELRLLPGFGAYTAGAVASIAFGERVPAIDGNVERVCARLVALEVDPSLAEGRGVVQGAVTALLDRVDPATLNQALMELGATVCTPRAPRCGKCPWANRCRAHTLGTAEDYPRRRPRRAAVEVVSFVAVAADRNGRFLFRRRPQGAHNAGLWELPSTGLLSPDGADADRELSALARELERRWKVQSALARVRHSITHHRITAVAHAVSDPDGGGAGPVAWLSPETATARGVTAATAKLLGRLPTLL
jgi:A/G-specific adenine glycosylase